MIGKMARNSLKGGCDIERLRVLSLDAGSFASSQKRLLVGQRLRVASIVLHILLNCSSLAHGLTHWTRLPLLSCDRVM